MLYQVLKHRTEDAPSYCVVSLGLSHYYEKHIRDLGIDVVELNLRNHPFISLRELKRTLRGSDTLCCWMYVSNLIGYLFGRKKVNRLVWGVTHSNLSKSHNSKKTLIINKICAHLSSNVDLIAYNGYRAMEVHRKSGYKPRKDCLINNGLDLTEYCPDSDAGKRFRSVNGIDNTLKVVLSVSRNHPIKDLPTFIKAYSLVAKHRDNTLAVMCGTGVTEDNQELREICEKNGLIVGKNILLLGLVENVPEALNCGDVYVLHSAGEAFPNTLIQAMACGVPVVSTDVGDVKKIIGKGDYVAEVGDYEAIAFMIEKILDMCEEEKSEMIKHNRTLVISKYNIETVVKEYEGLYSL